MVFFTRELYLGNQPDSGWERRATREWKRVADDYARYLEVVSPRLPESVRRLCREGLHDGVIRSASHRSGELILVINTENALSGFRGRRPVWLTFRGISGRVTRSTMTPVQISANSASVPALTSSASGAIGTIPATQEVMNPTRIVAFKGVAVRGFSRTKKGGSRWSRAIAKSVLVRL